MLYPNIARSLSESWECFGYVNNVDAWSNFEKGLTRIFGAGFMTLASKKIKQKYSIVDERKELMNALEEWTDAIGSNNYLHGDEITMPDLMVHGVLRSIAFTSTFREIMKSNESLRDWYKRVNDQLSYNSR
jgi:glutathione S-transferase